MPTSNVSQEPLTTHRYVRVCFGDHVLEPWMALYELRVDGQVLRHLQVTENACLFAPENVLFRAPVSLESLLEHERAVEIAQEVFEAFWEELAPARTLAARPRNRQFPHEGSVCVGLDKVRLRWEPTGSAPKGWAPVPGQPHLFAQGDPSAAHRVCAAVFLGNPITWFSQIHLAA